MASPDLFRSIRCFLLDLDGTFYLGDRLLPGARDLIEFFEARGIDYIFLTNNSSRNPRKYLERLHKFGIPVQPKHIFTSADATLHYLSKNFPGARLYLLGTPDLEEQFEQTGFPLTDEAPDVIVAGFDTTLTYNKLWKLCTWVSRGLPYIATHPDINCPTEDGFMPDIGAVIAFVQASTNRSPDIIIGKPFPPMVEALCERFNLSPGQMCMVGDRLYTDIAMKNAGINTVLVLSGEARLEDLTSSPYKPDFIFSNLADLLETLQKIL